MSVGPGPNIRSSPPRVTMELVSGRDLCGQCAQSFPERHFCFRQNVTVGALLPASNSGDTVHGSARLVTSPCRFQDNTPATPSLPTPLLPSGPDAASVIHRRTNGAGLRHASDPSLDSGFSGQGWHSVFLNCRWHQVQNCL